VHGLRPHDEEPISPGLGRSVFPTRKKGCLVVFSFWLGTAGNHLSGWSFLCCEGHFGVHFENGRGLLKNGYLEKDCSTIELAVIL
jgi:hypothetical protein